MTTIVTRAGKGSTLSWAEVDANFTNLNTDKAETTVTDSLTAAVALKAPIASPTFTGTVSGITNAMVGLGNVDNTSDATKNAATATLTNKTITAAKLKAAQLGDSGTATNNFTLTAEAVDGTMKLARGNIGATTQDLITVSSDNVITGASGATLVGNVPVFMAYRTGIQNVTTATYTKVQLNTIEYDSNNFFDETTNFRFQPTIAGYYQINATLYGGGSVSSHVELAIYKNGTLYTASFISSAGDQIPAVSALIPCNGSTDYIELYAYIVGTSPNIGGDYTTMSGFLVRP